MNGNNEDDPRLSHPGLQQQPDPAPFLPVDFTTDLTAGSPGLRAQSVYHPDLIGSPDLTDLPVGRGTLGSLHHPDQAAQSTQHPPDEPHFEQPAVSVAGFTQVWDSASPAPVWEQRPVQDPELEGERVLHDLETLAPAHLFTQVGLSDEMMYPVHISSVPHLSALRPPPPPTHPIRALCRHPT